MSRILTTDEMDGILTEHDKLNRYTVMLQCFDCTQWSRWNEWDENKSCTHCHGNQLDLTSMISERTFDPIRMAKRKIKKR